MPEEKIGFNIKSGSVTVNLTMFAGAVIDKDRYTFGCKSTNELINKVLLTFIDDAQASAYTNKAIHSAVVELKKNTYWDISKLEKIKSSYAKAQYDCAEEKRKKYGSSLYYKEGKSRKIELSDKLKAKINNSEECENPKYKRANKPKAKLYIEALIEEYAFLPFNEREMYAKQGLINRIQDIILQKKYVNIYTDTVANGKGEPWHSFPYRIVTDDAHTQSYLAAISYDVNKKMFTYHPLNLARLKETDIKDYNGPDLPMPDINEFKEMERRIARLAPQYIFSEEKETLVELSERGYKQYLDHPILSPIKEKDDGTRTPIHTLTFKTDEAHIYHYFSSFGTGATILSTGGGNKARSMLLSNLLNTLGNYYEPKKLGKIVFSPVDNKKLSDTIIQEFKLSVESKEDNKGNTLYDYICKNTRQDDIFRLLLLLGNSIVIKSVYF